MKLIPLLPMLLAFHLALAQKRLSEEMIEKAQQEQYAGNYTRAIAIYNRHLQESPGSVEGYAGRAFSKAKSGDHDGALTDYSIILEIQPDHYEARLGKANALRNLRRYTEAQSEYLELLSQDPGETTSVYFRQSASPNGTMQITTAQSDFKPVVMNYLGLTALALKDYKTARLWFDSAIAAQPREADYYVNRAHVRKELGDPRASDDLRLALQLNPDHTAALTSLASADPTAGNERDQYLNQAIESDTTVVEPLLERGFRRLSEGRFREALSDFEKAHQRQPRNPEILLNRGLAKEKLNDLQGAYEDYTSAIRIADDFAKAWVNRGNVLQKQGRFGEAEEDYSAAITFAADYGAAYYNRAIVRERMKKYSGACEDVKRAQSLGITTDPRLASKVCP